MIYDVTVYTSSTFQYEIEAKDVDEATELADERCKEEECPDVVEDIIVSESSNQYTDLQELRDEEERYERKEKDNGV